MLLGIWCVHDIRSFCLLIHVSQDETVSALRALKMVSLRLSISCFFPSSSRVVGVSGDTESHDTVENYFKGLSLDALACDITDVVPSLTTVSIMLEGHPNRPRTRMEIGAVLD